MYGVTVGYEYVIMIKSDGNQVGFIFLAIFIGALLYFIIIQIFNKLMYYIFKCEALGPFDALFLNDDRKNLSNIMACCFFEPLDYERTKDYILGKTANLHKCRSKLTMKFGQWWFQEMEGEEWKTKQNDIVVLVKDIHTDKELNEFIVKEQGIRAPFDNVQYTFYCIPDF